jgi:hypothetical protein
VLLDPFRAKSRAISMVEEIIGNLLVDSGRINEFVVAS